MKRLNLRDGEDIDWILDEVRKSILNQHYEVIVDNHIYVYFSENQIYKIPLSDVEQIQKFRNLIKGDDGFVPHDIFSNETELISAKRRINVNRKWGSGATGNYHNCFFSMPTQIERDFDCEPLKRGVKIEHIVSYTDIFDQFWQYVPVYSNFIVDWGDGSFSEVDYEYSHTFYHTYAASGTYQIVISARYEDPCGDLLTMEQNSTTYSETVSDHSCSKANYSIVAHNENGEKRMTSELWVKRDFFGEHQVAETKSYEWRDPLIGQEGWREEQAYVLAEIWWTFRDELCEIEYEGGEIMVDNMEFGGLETDWCYSCKSKRAGKSNSGDGNLFIKDDEVRSYHKVVNEGILLERNLVISTCD